MNNLKLWRIDRGLSQVELSHATNIPRYKIQLFEQGLTSFSIEELERIGSLLGLEVKNGKLQVENDAL